MFLFIEGIMSGLDFIKSILSFVWGILIAIPQYVALSLDFLYSFFISLPYHILGIISELPIIITIGLSSLLSIAIFISVIKLISYLRG